jgi:beta-phosphoglucomutase-like phosphatase (HAD superfamily)
MSVAPGQCAVIEDAEPGIASARAAGARVIALRTGYNAAGLAAAEGVVDDLTAIQVSITADGLSLRF